MKGLYYFSTVVAAVLIMVVLPGCTTEEELRSNRLSIAVQHFGKAQFKEVPDKSLTLSECIRMALEHNLDLKVGKMEEDVADRQKVSELLRMLPEINFNYTGTTRDRYLASSSRAEAAGGASYGASTSQKKDINYFNLDFALSVMDFGLAFFNTQQAQDRVYLRRQQRIRMAQNLILDVTKVYFNVAVYQRAKAMSEELLKMCKDRTKLIRELAEKKQLDPFRAFEETRKFNDMERRLEYYILQYDNSTVELRSLLGFYATNHIKVDDSVLDSTPQTNLPKMEIMEQIGLLNRPEMMERDIQRHISVVECYKIILSMFPNARLFIDFNASSNSFLYNQAWWDMGINAAINLMKLPMKIAQLSAQGKAVDAEDVKAYGQAITIMAQIRITHADILSNKAVFEQDDRTYMNYRDALSSARQLRKKAGNTSSLSQLELDHLQLQVTNANILRTLSLSSYHLAYFRLMNAMGLDKIDPKEIKELEKQFQGLQGKAELELQHTAVAAAAK